VQLTFSQNLGFFGFFWALPDNSNSVTFDTVGGNVTFTRADLGLGTGLGEGRYINFFASQPSQFIRSVTFNETAGFAAFEVRNVAYQAIPTPALLPGLVAVGAGLLQKRKAAAEAEG